MQAVWGDTRAWLISGATLAGRRWIGAHCAFRSVLCRRKNTAAQEREYRVLTDTAS
jgi:hypothetical protein